MSLMSSRSDLMSEHANLSLFPPQAGTLRKDAGIEPISYKSFIQTYNTQKRIPVVMYKQLAKVAKKTTCKILRKRGGPKTDEYVEKCVRFFERSSLPRMKTYLVRGVTGQWSRISIRTSQVPSNLWEF